MKQTIDLDALADLEEERRFLLQSIRDLDREHEAGDLDDDDYRTLKDDYTARAAAVLHAIDESNVHVAAVQERRRRNPKVTALVVAAVAVVAIVAGVLVASSSGERVPGQPTSGVLAGSSGATPRDLGDASRLFNQNKWADALGIYAKVLKRDPRNVEALSYGSWALAQLGQVEPALQSVDRALAVDPNYPPAHLFKGLLLLDARNDAKGAISELAAFLAAKPPPPAAMAQMVQQRLDEARAKVGSAGP